MAKHKLLRIPIRAVLYKLEDSWIAHSLDLDLCGDGKTKQEAFEQLQMAIELQVEVSLEVNNIPNIFQSADEEIHLMYAQGKDVVDALLNMLVIETKVPGVFEPPQAREYLGLETVG